MNAPTGPKEANPATAAFHAALRAINEVEAAEQRLREAVAFLDKARRLTSPLIGLAR